MRNLILLPILILLLSGCAEKELVFIKEPKFPMHTIDKPVDLAFPVRDDYVKAYKAWKAEMYETINNLNTQIDMYLKFKGSGDVEK